MSVICLVFFPAKHIHCRITHFWSYIVLGHANWQTSYKFGMLSAAFYHFSCSSWLFNGVCWLIEMRGRKGTSPCCSPVCSTSSRSCLFCYICLPLTGCLLVYLVRVFVCVCAHACVCTYMHAFMVCVHVRACAHACMHLCCVWECVCMRAHMHACIYGVCGCVYLCLAWVFVCVQTEHQHACQNLCNFECFETWFTDFFHWNFVHISFKILQQQSLDPLVCK